jgi:hypothetical protein
LLILLLNRFPISSRDKGFFSSEKAAVKDKAVTSQMRTKINFLFITLPTFYGLLQRATGSEQVE